MLLNKKHSIPIIHFLIWIMLLHLIFDLIGIGISIIELIRGEFIDEGIILIPTLIALFYINLDILIPRFMKTKTWLKYILYLLILMILLMGSGLIIMHLLVSSGFHSQMDLIDFFDSSLIFYLVTMGISTSIGFSRIAAQNERQRIDAYQKQKETEIKFLSTQVSPHFLFNSLNSIYALAEEENAEMTSSAILKLSEMMRYPFTDGMQEKVPLKKEVGFLNNFISMQRTKLGDDFPISFQYEIQNDELKIAPLLFVPLVENAFKYGVSRTSPKPIKIELTSNDNKITLLVKNSIFKRKEKISSGLGLKNLKERLALIYKDKHILKEVQENDIYEITLEISV